MKKTTEPWDRTLLLLVLVPHQETLRRARAYSTDLFRAGWGGARLLPPLIPLSPLDHSPSFSKLQEAARNLWHLKTSQEEPHFTSGSWRTIELVPGLPASGLSIDIPPLSQWFPYSLAHNLPPTLLLTFGDSKNSSPPSSFEPLRFRAAFLTLCCLRWESQFSLVPEHFFKIHWIIGKPCWLPRRFPPPRE